MCVACVGGVCVLGVCVVCVCGVCVCAVLVFLPTGSLLDAQLVIPSSKYLDSAVSHPKSAN